MQALRGSGAFASWLGFQVARALDILEQMACAGIQRFLATIDDPREIRRGRHGGTIPMERAATIQTTSDTLVLFSRQSLHILFFLYHHIEYRMEFLT